MKTILLPNDLSPAAENALSYAVEFALSRPEKTNLILLHVFDSALTNPLNTLELIATDVEAEERAVREKLEQMAGKYLRATGLKCTVVTMRGFVEDSIVRAAAAYEADFIFMGTKGADGLTGYLLGSNTSNLIKKAHCPVLAIPQKAFFIPYRTVVFANDFADEDLSEATRVVDLARHYGGKVVMLHISEKREEELDLRVLDFMKTQLQLSTGYQSIEVAAVHTDKFTQGLEDELKRHKAAMLVMAPRKRSFLKSLQSRTRQMVLQTAVPLLALPKMAEPLTEKPALESLSEISFN